MCLTILVQYLLKLNGLISICTILLAAVNLLFISMVNKISLRTHNFSAIHLYFLFELSQYKTIGHGMENLIHCTRPIAISNIKIVYHSSFFIQVSRPSYSFNSGTVLSINYLLPYFLLTKDHSIWFCKGSILMPSKIATGLNVNCFIVPIVMRVFIGQHGSGQDRLLAAHLLLILKKYLACIYFYVHGMLLYLLYLSSLSTG